MTGWGRIAVDSAAVAAALVAVVVVVRSWHVARWVARARSSLRALPCPACHAPFGPAAGRARPFSMFDVVVTCDACGSVVTVALTRGGPVLGVTLPAVAEPGRPAYLRLAVDPPDIPEGPPPCPPTLPPS